MIDEGSNASTFSLLPLTTTVTCLSSSVKAWTLYLLFKFSVLIEIFSNSLVTELSTYTLTVNVLELNSVIPEGFFNVTWKSLFLSNPLTSISTSNTSIFSTASWSP